MVQSFSVTQGIPADSTAGGSGEYEYLWTPLEILGNISAWLDSSVDGTLTYASDLVSLWADRGTSGYDAAQTTGARKPLTNTNTINSRNVLYFDGTDDTMTFSTDVLPADFSLYIVCNFTAFRPSGDTDHGVFSQYQSGVSGRFTYGTRIDGTDHKHGVFEGGGTGETLGSALSTGTNYLLSATCASDLFTAYLNGTQDFQVSLSVGVPSLNSRLGAYSDTVGLFNGNIAEVLVLNVTDTTNRQLVEGYMAYRGGTQSSLDASHPYKTLPPTL